MKHCRLFVLAVLLLGMQTEGRAQVFQVFGKDGGTVKFQAIDVDNISHNDEQGVTTFLLRNGNRQTFQKSETDSIVWYDPANSIYSVLCRSEFFGNFIRLVKEYPLWTDLLNGASDLTVFAANDNGWRRFYEENAKLPVSNPWYTATSYGALTANQKNALLAAAIIPARKVGEMSNQGYLRVRSKDGIGSSVWTPILTPEYCKANNITERDQEILFGSAVTTPWMSGTNIIDLDYTCTNGYVELVSAPLVPLATMADIIRNNGRTKIFAHMMESVQQQQMLKFDPSDVGYSGESDMAAMFVPSDEALWQFYTEEAGQLLLQNFYVTENAEEQMSYIKPTTQEELLQQIDRIPASVLSPLVNNIMMGSFKHSVPSMMTKIRDDAMEQLFCYEDVEQIDECLLACNGAVYIMNKVYGPKDYLSVIAPAYLTATNKVIRWGIYDQSYLELYYYAYLKNFQQDFLFFMPSDDAMQYCYDPISMKSRTPRAIALRYENASPGKMPIKSKCFRYIDPYGIQVPNDGESVGTVGRQIPGSAGTIQDADIISRLKDILLNHTIAGFGWQNINSNNEYYISLGGDVVKVVRDENGKIIGAKGSFQLENERNGYTHATPDASICKVSSSFSGLANGSTYLLDTPLASTYRSLWSILTDDMMETESKYNPKGYTEEAWEANPFSAFYDLCTGKNLDVENLILRSGLIDESLSDSEKRKALCKYLIFDSDNGVDYNFALLIGNTPFTAYIPTNEAVMDAIGNGLPTWEEISSDVSGGLQTKEDSIRVQNKIQTLTDVIKAHFYYGMIIVDKEPFRLDYKSLAMDPNTLVSNKLLVENMGNGRMTVTDWNNCTYNVLDNKNIFGHEYTCSKSPRGVALSGVTIDKHRPCVIHQIDGVLGFKRRYY